MEPITFRATIRRTGASYVVTIPRAYLKNTLVVAGLPYEFTIHAYPRG